MGYPMKRDHRLFSELATFADAFPVLADAEVEYREEGDGASGEPRVVAARDGSLEGLILCSNPHCKQGGFEIDLVFHRMIEARETTGEGAIKLTPDDRVFMAIAADGSDEAVEIEEVLQQSWRGGWYFCLCYG